MSPLRGKNLKIAPWVTPLKYCNFNQFFYIFSGRGLLQQFDPGQIWHETVHIHGLGWHSKFRLNVFIVSASGGQNHNFWQILTFGGNPVPTSFLIRPKFGVLRLHATFRLDRFILSPSSGEKPQILLFYWIRHFVVSPFGGDLRKLNTGVQLQDFLIRWYRNRFCIPWFQRLHGKIVRTNSDVQKRDVSPKPKIVEDAWNKH